MNTLSYKDYVKKLAEAFEARLASIEAIHNFDHGSEFEVVLCEALAATLPERFGVCRGFVVDKNSQCAGDDVIIFDQQNFPLLRLRDRKDFSRKQYVPIEAVYAYIEAKHTIEVDGTGGQSLQTSIEQVMKVKELCNQREKTDLAQSDPYLKLPFPVENPTVPKFRNPVFAVVFGRFVKFRNGSRVEDPREIHTSLASLIPTGAIQAVDLVVAGKNNLVIPSYKQGEQWMNPLFSLDGEKGGHRSGIVVGIAFGLGLIHLLAALDWVRLGRMPWEEIRKNAAEFGFAELK